MRDGAGEGAPIRVFAYVFFPAGGIGRYTSEWATAMNGQPGVEVTLLCGSDFAWKASDAYSVWDGLRPLSHPIPPIRRARFLRGQFVNPLRAVRYAAREGAGVLHFATVNHLSSPLWQRALERAEMKVTATVHDVQRRKAILHRRWETRQLTAFYRYADALFVHSDQQRDELVAFAGVDAARVHVVPHGPYAYAPPAADVRTLRRRYGLPEVGQVALCFGQLRDQKNLDGLLDAVALRRLPVHLFVAGNAPNGHRPHRHYVERAEALGLAERVTFLPRYIPDEEVGDLFTASDWVALPYRSDFTSQSGVLNVAVQYHRPVLVSEAPVLRETVAQCDIGVVAESNEPEALARGVERLMERVAQEDPFAFEQYRARNSWAENARRSRAVFEELVGVRGRT